MKQKLKITKWIFHLFQNTGNFGNKNTIQPLLREEGGGEGFTPKQIDDSYPNKQTDHSECEYTTQSGNLKAHSQKHTRDIGATN